MTKIACLEAILEKHMATIILDARQVGVVVPAHLKGEHRLVLNLSYLYRNVNLQIDDWGVRAVLSFDGSDFATCVPWSAIYMISNPATNAHQVYPEGAPFAALEKAAQDPQPAAEKPRRHLSLVKN